MIYMNEYINTIEIYFLCFLNYKLKYKQQLLVLPDIVQSVYLRKYSTQ